MKIAFVPPPRPGAIARSLSVESHLPDGCGIRKREVRHDDQGRADILGKNGVYGPAQVRIGDGDLDILGIEEFGADKDRAAHASLTATLTSSSIAAANCSRSSWLSRAESRVFGFLGLYGMRAGGHMVYRGMTGDEKKVLIGPARESYGLIVQPQTFP